MKKKRSLFEKKMANRKFREQIGKEYPLFEQEVERMKEKELKEGYKVTRREDGEKNFLLMRLPRLKKS
jgi:hypothetical protein